MKKEMEMMSIDVIMLLKQVMTWSFFKTYIYEQDNWRIDNGVLFQMLVPNLDAHMHTW